MMTSKWIKITFGASALYDGLLGIVFLFFGSMSLDLCGIEKPYNMGFLHFPAMLLILFSLMYWRLATNPVKYRILIPYGIGLKISYASVAFYHWFADSVPTAWLALAWIDVLFIILFFVIWKESNRITESS